MFLVYQEGNLTSPWTHEDKRY